LAWSIIPEPKIDYKFNSQILIRTIFKFLLEAGFANDAIAWLPIIEALYSEQDPSVRFMKGKVYFEAGILDSAFIHFDSLFKEFKARPFQGDDPKYLAFYKAECSKRK